MPPFSRQSPPLIVSFVGRAGVGKSKLARALTDELAAPLVGLRSVLVHGGTPPPFFALSNLAHAWGMHQVLRKELSPWKAKGWRDGVKTLQLLLANEGVTRRSMKSADVCVLDERGVYHSLLRLGLRSTNPGPIAWGRLLNASWFTQSQPDILVLCELAEDERLRRRAARGRSHDRVLQKDSTRREFFDRNWGRAWPHIMRAAQDAHAAQVLTLERVDMAASIEENVDRLLRVVLGSTKS